MEALSAGGLTDQDRSGERPAPCLSEQLGAMGGQRSRSSRFSTSASRVSTPIRLTCSRETRTRAVCGIARKRRVTR
jgi:hypothetical protein